MDECKLVSLPMTAEERPRTRGECPENRPCPWIGCRYHLYLDVHPKTGALHLNYPDREPSELDETCALDVAERAALDDGLTLEEVGDAVQLAAECVRQIEASAMTKLRTRARELKS